MSRLSTERKGPDSKVVRHRMKQIQRRCEKLGLDTARSDGRNKGEDGSSTGGGEGESAAAKRRESALLALIETCMTASEAILQPGGKPALSRPPPLGNLAQLRSSHHPCHSVCASSFHLLFFAATSAAVFQRPREHFNRCLILGANADAAAAYKIHLRRSLTKGLECAISPLERRKATKKDLSKMVSPQPQKTISVSFLKNVARHPEFAICVIFRMAHLRWLIKRSSNPLFCFRRA